jgi:hypothetical protein
MVVVPPLVLWLTMIVPGFAWRNRSGSKGWEIRAVRVRFRGKTKPTELGDESNR